MMADGSCHVDFSDYSDDADPVEFWKSTTMKARKPHQCAECGSPIQAGETYQRNTYKFEGEMCRDSLCAPCVEAAVEFNHRVTGMLWELFREEWSNGAHLQACVNRLTTARAKEHMRRQWLKWKGIDPSVTSNR